MPSRAQRRAAPKVDPEALGVDGAQDVEGFKKASRRGFAAMLFAQREGCDCKACKLLRAEMDGMMDEVMAELEDVDEGTTT